MAPDSVVELLLRAAGECSSKHLRKATYSAVDALMDASFPLKVTDFTVESPVFSPRNENVDELPHRESLAALYLDMCSIYLLLSWEQLPRDLVVVSASGSYSVDEAKAICHYYLSVVEGTGQCTAIVVQLLGQSWRTVHAHRLLGEITYLDEFTTDYTSRSLAGKLREADVSDTCLVVNHSTPDDDTYKFLGAICAAKWSVGSDSGCVPALTRSTSEEETLLLPVYSHARSSYVRAVLDGGRLTACYPDVPRSLCDISFYTSYVRGAKMRSGRCWDCESLHRLATRLRIELRRRRPADDAPGPQPAFSPFEVGLSSDMASHFG